MSGLRIFILIAIAFPAVVWPVNRSHLGETRTPEQAHEDWQRKSGGLKARHYAGFGRGGF